MTAIYRFNLTFCLLLCSSMAFADPTAPEAELQSAATAAVAPQALPKLSLIRSQGRSFQALIDGVLVKTGDKVGAYQVQSISASQVILQQGDKRLQLNLFNRTTK